MTGIILSIILTLGSGVDSPTGDFDTATAVDQPVATSQSTTTNVQRKK
ncbi:MAG TPA: hypothetical protein VJT69_20550 [Pyrinomonadaceae bacterium]|nr:hypothetical protein [Pyrinomonadaceae bacterium]